MFTLDEERYKIVVSCIPRTLKSNSEKTLIKELVNAHIQSLLIHVNSILKDDLRILPNYKIVITELEAATDKIRGLNDCL